MMSEGPPLTIDRMQKPGEIYADPEAGLTWIVYDPPLAGVVMEGFLDSDIEVQEALEFDEEGNLRFTPTTTQKALSPGGVMKPTSQVWT
jgi:hypothetical protein